MPSDPPHSPRHPPLRPKGAPAHRPRPHALLLPGRSRDLRARLRHPHWGRVLLGSIVLVLCTIELVLLASEYRLIGSLRWRTLAVQYGAFWAGLLHGWQPNYPGQPALMFFTYGLLHGGPAHLLGNMAALLWIGPMLLVRMRARALAVLWCLSVLGGGVAFGLLSTSPTPMVGASGAIFGLTGAWVIWLWRDRQAEGGPGRPGRTGKPGRLAGFGIVIWAGLAMAGLNAAMWLLQGGIVAWEAHLGGYLTGSLWALLIAPRPPSERP